MSDTKPRSRGGRRTPGEITDLSRYAKGDRDEAARKAHTKDVRERRVAAREARAAAVAAREAAVAGSPGDDEKLIQRTNVMLSRRILALIKPLLGDDMALGQWIRDAVLERLARELDIDPEDLDTARRPVQRRANYSERQQREEGQER